LVALREHLDARLIARLDISIPHVAVLTLKCSEYITRPVAAIRPYGLFTLAILEKLHIVHGGVAGVPAPGHVVVLVQTSHEAAVVLTCLVGQGHNNNLLIFAVVVVIIVAEIQIDFIQSIIPYCPCGTRHISIYVSIIVFGPVSVTVSTNEIWTWRG